jgi:hypothetical protein
MMNLRPKEDQIGWCPKAEDQVLKPERFERFERFEARVAPNPERHPRPAVLA